MTTTMEQAFKAKGVLSPRKRLVVLAADARRAYPKDYQAAAGYFAKNLAADEGAASEFLSNEGFQAALKFLRGHGGGQNSLDAQDSCAAPTIRDEERGQATNDTHHAIAPSSHPIREREGHEVCGTQSINVLPSREPSANDRKIAGSIAKKLALSALDSFKVRDGRSIGDVRYGEIEKLKRDNTQEAAVLRLIQKRIGHAPSDAKIRDIIGSDQLQRFIQLGAEVADAT